ncbi:ECF transporter S component [Lactiplantibacillus daowaiensis]|uniref:ECF transporter S component n=1 Tax=Lactiplantibacillus daowaiensis TaxID=2559918 RepID=A0ABW1S304_9LACO|nr:ECF transporter S component [Lactiplantibacillus daowaiensis]
MGQSKQLRKVIFASLFAAIIFVGISVLRIPLPAIVGRPFVHFGNTLTILAVMLLGFGYGAAAGAIGLGLFDILNGYAATAWLTVLEAIILAAMVNLVFKAIGYDEQHLSKLYLVSFLAGLTKLITSWGNGVIVALMAGTTLKVAMIGSFASLLSALINSVVSFLIVPLLYQLLVKVGFSRSRFLV